ncbi:CapA family protein [Veillonella sp.]
MKIYIGADFVPTDINRSAFENGNIHTLIGPKLYDMLCTTDLNIFNLEVPLTDNDTPIDKFGHNLKSPTKTINGFKAIPSLLLGLANNHSYDQGPEGLQSTINTLTQAGIAYSGAGSNINEAKKPYIFTKDGIRLGIYVCTENEFSSATIHRAGANPFDVLDSFDHVQALKEQCDYVVVLYHGGKEFYRYPSPMLQRYCRKFIEKGASLVVCQHSHCIGA